MRASKETLALAGAAYVAVFGVVAYEKRRHAHACPNCATRWEHSSLFQITKAMVDKAHKCPSCGTDWRWHDDPLDPVNNKARLEDAARVRRGEPALYAWRPT